MTNRAALTAAALAVLAASLAACSSGSTSAPGSPPAPASAPAPSPSAPARPSATASPAGDSPTAEAKACAELDAWQKAHGNSAAPPQAVFNDLIDTPQPLSGDFFAWDLAAGTSQPAAEADLLKVWTDCAKAEAAALGG